SLVRLADGLADPRRGERAVIWLLLAYTIVWTLYGILAKSSQDLHYDMAELVGLSRDLALGYPHHPPLASFVVKLWFLIFPLADWAYYLLSIALAAVALWIAWRLLGRYLDGEKRAAGLLLLTLIPFYNFHALKFNLNTLLIPLWAVTTLWFIRSFETRSRLYAVLAGLGAAACMLGKYWSIFLLAGLAIAALLDPRRGSYFRSAAPYITIGIGLLALVPHLAWLVGHDFSPFAFALDAHGRKSFAAAVIGALSYLAGSAAYAALPAVLAIWLFRPSAASLRDSLWPGGAQRRFAATAFWATLLLPLPVALAGGLEVKSLWTMSAWTLLPVVLLSSPRIEVTRRALAQLLAIAIALPLAMTAAAPVIAYAIHKAGVFYSQAHARLLAPEIARVWRETTDRPLLLVGGDGGLAYGAAFYLPQQPSVFSGLSQKESPWVDDARIAREGIVAICRARDPSCIRAMNALAARSPAGRRSEIEVARNFLGMPGAPERYLIVTMPPR
ncbi:MAG: glycosyltransferase family 39 protein, partial [Pseudomonadota bacterium]|nr:glycosyltransferase family 39 protein [Pseudomonadota bacterium]